MIQLSTKVSVQLGGLETLSAAMARGELSGPEFAKMRIDWAARYSAFVKRRFDENSLGAGEWPALALSTVRARQGPDKRRKGKGGGSRDGVGARSSLARNRKGHLVDAGTRAISILRDSGNLRRALSIGDKGNRVNNLPMGVEYGFLAVPHVGKKAKGFGPTYAQIASWHNSGTPRMPKRLILAKPNEQTTRGMAADLSRAIAAIRRRGEQANRGGVK